MLLVIAIAYGGQCWPEGSIGDPYCRSRANLRLVPRFSATPPIITCGLQSSSCATSPAWCLVPGFWQGLPWSVILLANSLTWVRPSYHPTLPVHLTGYAPGSKTSLVVSPGRIQSAKLWSLWFCNPGHFFLFIEFSVSFSYNTLECSFRVYQYQCYSVT